MNAKGYPFPLYSLNLVDDATTLDDDPRYCISLGTGRLVVRRQLRLRGRRLHCVRAMAAVDTALAYRDRNAAGFAEHGFDDDWAASMRHWRDYLDALNAQGLRLRGEGQLGTQALGAAMKQAQGMWKRLSTSAALAGLSGRITPTAAAPRTHQALINAMAQVTLRLTEQAALLAQHGFGPERQQQWAQAAQNLADQHQQSAQHGWGLQQLLDMQTVIKGALLGDLSRLSSVAGLVLLPQVAVALQVQRLLSLPPRQPKGKQPAPALSAPTPGE